MLFPKVIGNFMFDLVTFFRLVPWTSYHKKIFNYSILLNTNKGSDPSQRGGEQERSSQNGTFLFDFE